MKTLKHESLENIYATYYKNTNNEHKSLGNY